MTVGDVVIDRVEVEMVLLGLGEMGGVGLSFGEIVLGIVEIGEGLLVGLVETGRGPVLDLLVEIG